MFGWSESELCVYGEKKSVADGGEERGALSKHGQRDIPTLWQAWWNTTLVEDRTQLGETINGALDWSWFWSSTFWLQWEGLSRGDHPKLAA